MLSQMIGFPSFFCNNIPLYIYQIFKINSSVYRHLDYFHVVVIMNNAVMNVEVQIPLWNTDFISFRYIPKSGIAVSYGSSIFNFLMKLHTVFHSGSSNLHSHQQGTKVPFSPHFHQYSLSLDFLIIAISTDVGWYLIMALICIPLVVSDVKHHFMYVFSRVYPRIQGSRNVTTIISFF